VWTLTAEDVRIAKTKTIERRRVVEEELNTIDAELANLEAIEKLANSFLAKHRVSDVSEFSSRKSDLHESARSQDSVTNWGSSQLISASPKAGQEHRN
jgi:hypothetical protein